MEQKLNFLKQILLLIFLLNTLIISQVSADPYGVTLSLTSSHPPEIKNSAVCIYSYGEEVVVNISLGNEGKDPITIMGVPPMIVIRDENGSDIRKYLRNESAKILLPSESWDYEFFWDQKNKNGEQVNPGMYSIDVFFLYSPDNDKGVWDLSNIRQNSWSVQILVEEPQGYLEKKIAQDVTKQNSGVTATLVSLDFNRMKGTAVFNVEIPEKSVDTTPRPEGLVPCDVSAYPTGRYRVDNKDWSNFIDIHWTCDTSPRQVHEIVVVTEPLPADAELIEIEMTGFGNHEGKWDYLIDLTPSGTGQISSQESQRPSSSKSAPLGMLSSLTGLVISGAIVICLRKKR